MFRHPPLASQDGWINDYFNSRTAGAEFMLPWFIDTYFTSLARLKDLFTLPELKTILEAHKNMIIDTAHLRLAHLLLQVTERCDRNNLNERYGADLTVLENKFRQLDDTQAATLILWASSFWRSQTCTEEAMEIYVSKD